MERVQRDVKEESKMTKINVPATSNINENLKFLLWISQAIKKGYLPYLKVTEIQGLVDKIVTYYENKYPNKNSIVLLDGTYDFTNNKTSKSLAALPDNLTEFEKKLFDCDYRMGRSTNFENGTIGLCITDQFGIGHYLQATSKDGTIVENLGAFEGARKDRTKPLVLDDLQEILSSCPKYDITELSRIVFAHNCDLKLREVVLDTVALALRNSKSSFPRVAEARANKWVKEISNYLNIAYTSNVIFPSDEKDTSKTKRLIATQVARKADAKIISNCQKIYNQY